MQLLATAPRVCPIDRKPLGFDRIDNYAPNFAMMAIIQAMRDMGVASRHRAGDITELKVRRTSISFIALEAQHFC